MKFLFFTTLGLILMYSIISMAKPGFYMFSLNSPPEFVLELGPPLVERSSPNHTEYLYRAGMVKPFCIDYAMTFIHGRLTTWTWHFCTMAPPALPPPTFAENPL
ncbi:MAG TPA: hypothetical protein VGJ57_00855 [Nitrospirales bacterium]|jgi:hypothetical protein